MCRKLISNCFSSKSPRPEFYSLSLHDALPISVRLPGAPGVPVRTRGRLAGHLAPGLAARSLDRKSTRLNSSHMSISYAVFCLKKKTKTYFKVITKQVTTTYFFIAALLCHNNHL